MSRRSWPVASLLAAVVLLAGCAGGGSGEQASAPSSSPAPDVSAVRTDLAPCPAQPDTPAAPSDLPAVRLSCFSGGALDLAKAPGEPTVLNLWASWCGPCRTELPIVQQLADTAGNRIRVLGLVSKDGVAQAASFADDAGVTFPSAFDADGEVMDDLALRGLPYTYFLAADGSVAYVQVGPVSSLADLQQLVADHLGVRL